MLLIDPSAKIPVEHDGHTLYVRQKMDIKTDTAVTVEFRRLSGRDTLTNKAYELALLKHNIVDWDGPDFKDVPCTPSNIERLDPDNELVKLALRKIDELNRPALADKKGDDDDQKKDGSDT